MEDLHKDYLVNHASRLPTATAAICHAGLYLGRILEMLLWIEASKPQAARTTPPDWWANTHPCPEDMP